MRGDFFRLNGSPPPRWCFHKSHSGSCRTAGVVWNDLFTTKMLGEIALLAQKPENVRIGQQFVTLDGDAFPFVDGSYVTLEKAENIISESGRFASCLRASNLDDDWSIWPRNL